MNNAYTNLNSALTEGLGIETVQGLDTVPTKRLLEFYNLFREKPLEAFRTRGQAVERVLSILSSLPKEDPKPPKKPRKVKEGKMNTGPKSVLPAVAEDLGMDQRKLRRILRDSGLGHPYLDAKVIRDTVLKYQSK